MSKCSLAHTQNHMHCPSCPTPRSANSWTSLSLNMFVICPKIRTSGSNQDWDNRTKTASTIPKSSWKQVPEQAINVLKSIFQQKKPDCSMLPPILLIYLLKHCWDWSPCTQSLIPQYTREQYLKSILGQWRAMNRRWVNHLVKQCVSVLNASYKYFLIKISFASIRNTTGAWAVSRSSYSQTTSDQPYSQTNACKI